MVRKAKDHQIANHAAAILIPPDVASLIPPVAVQRHHTPVHQLRLGGARPRGDPRPRLSTAPKYSLRVAALLSDTLCALHLNALQLSPPCLPAPEWFARLRQCHARLTDLQAIVDATPLLVVMELDRIHLSTSWLRCCQEPAPDATDGSAARRSVPCCSLTLAARGASKHAYWAYRLQDDPDADMLVIRIRVLAEDLLRNRGSKQNVQDPGRRVRQGYSASKLLYQFG